MLYNKKIKQILFKQLRWYFIGFLVIIVILGIGLRLYNQNPIDTTNDESTTSPEMAGKIPTGPEIPKDWLKYRDEVTGIEFYHPKDWQMDSQSQIFKDGDLVSYTMSGSSQKKQTEFYDGGRFTVASPVIDSQDLDEWIKKTFIDNPMSISQEVINGQNFDRVYFCTTSCFTYYFIKVNDTIYGLSLIAEGPQKDQYKNIIYQMMDTIIIPELLVH